MAAHLATADDFFGSDLFWVVLFHLVSWMELCQFPRIFPLTLTLLIMPGHSLRKCFGAEDRNKQKFNTPFKIIEFGIIK